MVHEVAMEGFGAQAEVYERARPSYPPEAVTWIADALGLGPGKRCVDLAAGTGKLTRLLVPSGADLVAVEPVAGMRSQLVGTCPEVPVVAGTAEHLPVADDSLDAVTIAQAFHWFDHEAATAELRRALRVGGGLGLLWNARDRSVDWVDRLWTIMDRVEKRAPWRDHDEWRESAYTERRGFSPMQVCQFTHTHELASADVVARVASVSHVAVLDDGARQAVLDEVVELLETDPQTSSRNRHAIPYRVDAMWCRRID